MTSKLNRRGAALFIMLASIGVLLMVSAYAINVAYMQLAKSELRAAADAAARAGTEALARVESTDAAKTAAITIAAANKVGGKTLKLTKADVEIGTSRPHGNSGKWDFLSNGTPYGSVRVKAKADTNLFMARVTGRQSFSSELVATAAYSENEICLVIDRSHSMCFDLSGSDWVYPKGTPRAPPDPIVRPPHATGSRWASLASSVNVFLDTLANSAAPRRVALLTWGSKITTSSYEGRLTGRSFPATSLDVPLTTDTSKIRTAIADRGSDVMLGGTHMSAGIEEGIKVLTGSGTRVNASKIMILMTDGRWNIGKNPNATANDAKRAGITIHTVTFLDRAEQTDMKKVAKATGGQHYHASSTSELGEAFRKIAESLPVVLID